MAPIDILMWGKLKSAPQLIVVIDIVQSFGNMTYSTQLVTLMNKNSD